jgi:hypothetical protein
MTRVKGRCAKSKRIFWLAFGAFFVPGLCVFLSGVYLAWLEVRFHFNSIETRATVTDKWTRRSQRTGWKRYLVAYRLRTPEGRKFDGDGSVAISQWEALTVGDALFITIIKGRPQNHRLVNDWEVAQPLIMLLVGGLCASIGGAISYLETHPAKRKPPQLSNSPK